MNKKHALVGKIARLPVAIREELNDRLLDNQPSTIILPWLNAFPSVQKILADQFGGKPVTAQNLTNWRYSGFQRWLKAQGPFPGAAAALDANLPDSNEGPPPTGEQMRIIADFFVRILDDEQIGLIANASIAESEKIELIGRHLFGDRWIPPSELSSPVSSN